MLFEFWRGENFRKKISAGTLVFLRSRRRRKLVWNAQLQTWRTVDTDYGRCRGRKLQRQWTFGILSYRCVGSELLEQGRWTRYDSHQRWTFERRSFVSHTFIKSSQYLRNSADTLSFPSMEKSVSIGKVLACPKLEPQEVEYVGTDTEDECSRSGRPTANVIKVSQACESHGFMRKVFFGQ